MAGDRPTATSERRRPWSSDPREGLQLRVRELLRASAQLSRAEDPFPRRVAAYTEAVAEELLGAMR